MTHPYTRPKVRKGAGGTAKIATISSPTLCPQALDFTNARLIGENTWALSETPGQILLRPFSAPAFHASRHWDPQFQMAHGSFCPVPSCRGCRRNRVATDIEHTRRDGCRCQHVARVIYRCPGCQARADPSADSHTLVLGECRVPEMRPRTEAGREPRGHRRPRGAVPPAAGTHPLTFGTELRHQTLQKKSKSFRRRQRQLRA